MIADTSVHGDARIELEIQALKRIGDVHYAFGAMSNSAVAYETAAARAMEAGLEEARVTVLTAMAFPVLFIDPVKGEQICDLAMQSSRSLSDPVLRARTELAVACFRLLYGSWTAEDVEVCTLARKTLDVHTDSISPPHVHHIYVQVLQGEFAAALKQADVLIKTAAEPAYTLAFGGRGFVFMATGVFGGMLGLVRRGRELSAKNESPGWMWILGEAWLRLLCFDFEGARRLEEITMPVDMEPHALWLRTVARICAGYLEIAGNNYEKARAAFATVRDYEVTPQFFLHWHFRMHAQLGTVEAHLSAGELPSANLEAVDFLESALSVSDPNLRALAWEMNARVAAAEGNCRKAREHIDNALAVLDKFEIPPAGWKVHRTAGEICRTEGNMEASVCHRARAREMIMSIAGSFEPDEPLRECFLEAPPVRRVLEQSVSM